MLVVIVFAAGDTGPRDNQDIMVMETGCPPETSQSTTVTCGYASNRYVHTKIFNPLLYQRTPP